MEYPSKEGHTDFIFLPASDVWQEYVLSGSALLGWLLPLIVGICLWRRARKIGRVLVGLGAVWGVLALAFAGWGFGMMYGFMPKRFNPATYQGA